MFSPDLQLLMGILPSRFLADSYNNCVSSLVAICVVPTSTSKTRKAGT